MTITNVQRIQWAVVMWLGLAFCSACALLSRHQIKQAQETAEAAADTLQYAGEALDTLDEPKPDVGSK